MARGTDDPPPPSSPRPVTLPPKVAAAVLRYLPSHADRVRFAAVCRRPWLASPRHHQPRRTTPLPWLALPDGTFFNFPTTAALRFPDAAGYHGSCDDWLLFHGAGGFVLANPFSGATARLPPLTGIRFADDERAHCGMAVRKLVTCGPGSAVAAIVVGDGRRGKIAVCRLYGDSWAMSSHDAWRGFTDIAFHDGKVYAIEGDTGDLFSISTGVDTHTGEPTVACAKIAVKASSSDAAPVMRRRCQQEQKAPPATRYLFVSGGSLHMVHRSVTSDGAAKFAVFKAVLAKSRWSEVKRIPGDTALFIGRWCTLCQRLPRRASHYKLPGNRIYFLNDDAFPHQFGSYDMRRGVTYPLLRQLELCNGTDSSDTPATWLFPKEQETVSIWCDLPSDVFGQVLRSLPSLKDRLRLRLVCRDWCASLRQHLRWRQEPTRSPKVAKALAPAVAMTTMAYLAFPNGSVYSYPELTSPRLDRSAVSYVGAACNDWLLFHDDDIFRLTSPITGKTRLLPSFDDVRTHGYPVEIVNEPAQSHSALAAPRITEWGNDTTMAVRKLVVCPDNGFIAAVFGQEHFAKVVLCSLETFSWSHSGHDRWRWYDDLEFCNGKLYALTAGEDLLALDVGVDGTTGEPFVARVERVVVGHDRVFTTGVLHYLVPFPSDGGGDLLMVRREFTHAGDRRRPRFTVLRADMASARWEAVSDLGRGVALFVGRLCSKAVRERGLRGNQVFFLPDDGAGMEFLEQGRRRAEHHAAVYDMLHRSVIGILPREQDDRSAPPTWLFPDTTMESERDSASSS